LRGRLDSLGTLCEREIVRGGLGALGALVTCGALFAACGSLDTPTRPEPTPAPPSAPVAGQPGPTPTPTLGLPGPAPTPTPEASPGPNPSPTPASPGEGAGSCGAPVPPPLASINVKIHVKGEEAWIIDSTPLVGPDPNYCAQIGYTDGRVLCPVRLEGNAARAPCELYVTGRAKDTGRPGPTWYFNGSLCTGPAMGCKNHPENQFQALVYKAGLVRACGMSGVCGEVTVDR
jgi:hypothetical protein